jgi:hypothetical protein
MSSESNSKRGVSLSLALFALVLGLAAGAGTMLWLWKSGAPAGPMEAAQAATPGGGPCNGKPPKLYRNPMGAPDTSPVPK